MGVQTDFFVASRSELDQAFPGWRRPQPLLPEFVTRTVRNPFTGKPTTIRSRIPESRQEVGDNATERPNLRGLTLVDQKGLSTVNLAQLARALMTWEEDDADSEIHGRLFVGPPEAGVLLDLPGPLVARLADLTGDDLRVVGTQWAALFRKDADSIGSDFVREHELARPDSEWIGRLGELAQLARQARDTSRDMFMWVTL